MINHQLNPTFGSTQSQPQLKHQQRIRKRSGHQATPIWNNRRFPHIYGTFAQSTNQPTPSLKDLIVGETEFQQLIHLSKSQIEKLENQRKGIENLLFKHQKNSQNSQASNRVDTNDLQQPTSLNTTNIPNNSNTVNQTTLNDQIIPNRRRTRRQTRSGAQNTQSRNTIKPPISSNSLNTLNNNIKIDPQIRKRKSPGELNKEKSTAQNFTVKNKANEISNTHKRQRNNPSSRTTTKKKKNNTKHKKAKPRSNKKLGNSKEENSDEEIKRIIEQINFFDSEDNETASEEDDFISTRTEPSKVWNHIKPWFEDFTEESVGFIQQSSLDQEGYSEIPPLYQISWNFSDFPQSTTNNSHNSQYHNSNNNSSQSQQQQKQQTQTPQGQQKGNYSKVFYRLLGSLIEADPKSSNLAHKNKRLVDQLDQLKSTYQYWKDPKDPRLPRVFNGTTTKELVSQASRDTHSQVKRVQRNANSSLKAFSELIRVGLVIEPPSNSHQKQDDDQIYQRLKLLMTRLNKVSERNNKYKQQMLNSTKEIITKENNWKIRFQEILALEKKYKDLVKQSNRKKKSKSRKK
ncbi:hypothetical protein M0812_12034 [Anaeramoeba flamelloides]|uniref:PARP catalytic domain-containing protein n=1 Tax=Anaeramoeba flamelloides TaxID=1746091 RepID=A0AAV7ZQM0_9EUKA|nr:hypothetical protein M0812_12034 [Anaeramoeba flamelloides]